MYHILQKRFFAFITVGDEFLTRKRLCDELVEVCHFIQLDYTNDAWEVVSAGRPLTGGVSGYPILLRAPYAAGNLYVLTIPDDMGNLYDFPAKALNEIRRIMSRDMDIYLEAPSKVGLFVYDNKTLVVENFNDEPVEVRIVTDDEVTRLENLENGDILAPLPAEPVQSRRPVTPKNSFRLSLLPHSYKAFQYK